MHGRRGGEDTLPKLVGNVTGHTQCEGALWPGSGMFPEAGVVKAWFPVCPYPEVMKTLRGLVEIFRPQEVCPEGVRGNLAPLALSLPGHQVSSFASLHAPVMMCHHRPKVMGPSDHGLRQLKLCIAIKLFSLQADHLRHLLQ